MTAAVSGRKRYRSDSRCSPPRMYHFEDKRSAPVAMSNSQVLPLVSAVVTLACALLFSVIHGIVRRKAKGWKEWNPSDQLIRRTPLRLPLRTY
jgi:hypothetical protein